MLRISCHFGPFDSLTLRMDHAKLLDVLMSLPVSHAILPRAVCFATSCPANQMPCSYISGSGWASEPIRRCLFIDHIMNGINKCPIRYVVRYLHLNIYVAVGRTVFGCMSFVLVLWCRS